MFGADDAEIHVNSSGGEKRHDDTVEVRGASELFDRGDTIEDAKEDYVQGDIGLLELEERLEQCIDVDVPYNPV